MEIKDLDLQVGSVLQNHGEYGHQHGKRRERENPNGALNSNSLDNLIEEIVIDQSADYDKTNNHHAKMKYK